MKTINKDENQSNLTPKNQFKDTMDAMDNIMDYLETLRGMFKTNYLKYTTNLDELLEKKCLSIEEIKQHNTNYDDIKKTMSNINSLLDSKHKETFFMELGKPYFQKIRLETNYQAEVVSIKYNDGVVYWYTFYNKTYVVHQKNNSNDKVLVYETLNEKLLTFFFKDNELHLIYTNKTEDEYTPQHNDYETYKYANLITFKRDMDVNVQQISNLKQSDSSSSLFQYTLDGKEIDLPISDHQYIQPPYPINDLTIASSLYTYTYKGPSRRETLLNNGITFNDLKPLHFTQTINVEIIQHPSFKYVGIGYFYKQKFYRLDNQANPISFDTSIMPLDFHNKNYEFKITPYINGTLLLTFHDKDNYDTFYTKQTKQTMVITPLNKVFYLKMELSNILYEFINNNEIIFYNTNSFWDFKYINIIIDGIVVFKNNSFKKDRYAEPANTKLKSIKYEHVYNNTYSVKFDYSDNWIQAYKNGTHKKQDVLEAHLTDEFKNHIKQD